jgi:hypothetical protein
MTKIFYILFLITIFIFTGCTSTTSCKRSFGQDISHLDIISALPIDKYIDDMSKELYPRYGGGNIVITDFVNTTTYTATPSGIIMAELLKTAISRNTSARVIQADFGRSFKLTPLGLVALTRDIKKIMPTRTSASIALVGSFNIVNNSLYMFIKRINIRSATVVQSAYRKISFSCFGDYIIDSTIFKSSKKD